MKRRKNRNVAQMGKPENLLGRTFNSWTPLSLASKADSKGKRTYVTWRCRCVCGTEANVLAKALKSGESRGCTSCAAERKRQWGFDKKRVDLRSAAMMIVHRSYIKRVRSRATIAGVEFDLDHSDLERLLLHQDFKCALSGASIGFASSMLSNRQANLHHTASLIRIDSKRGFTLGNVCWVHKDVGGMRMDLPLDRFIDLCRMVAMVAA